MSKFGKKLIAAAREMLAWKRGEVDLDVVDYIQDSCGCVFCDLGLDPIDGKHIVRTGHSEPCGLLKAPQ